MAAWRARKQLTEKERFELRDHLNGIKGWSKADPESNPKPDSEEHPDVKSGSFSEPRQLQCF
jgi:hypothetical protein